MASVFALSIAGEPGSRWKSAPTTEVKSGSASIPRDSMPVAVRNADDVVYFTPNQSIIVPAVRRNTRSSFTTHPPFTEDLSARMFPAVRGLLIPLSMVMLLLSVTVLEVVISMPESALFTTVLATIRASTALCTSMPWSPLE